jgi:ATP-dependent DNA helicase UvrD/PcrA
MTELLNQLNDKQKEAVLQTEGPVLVLAGAGSGKTRALTFRVAYLIKEKRISPKNILAVTFTNKAAGEMGDRIKELLNLPKNTSIFSQSLPHIGTFHSICSKILRREAEKIGYDKNFIIYDDQDQQALIKRVMKALEISSERIKPKAILGAISDAKNKLIDAQSFEDKTGSYFEEIVARCYGKYAEELQKANAFDFDDLIMMTVKIFNQNPEVLKYYQNLFHYIMVDEYQDTNHAQYTLLKMLAQEHKNICVVGDDFQSIYGWRGADIRNILSFEEDYPGAKVVLLEQNYRSTQNILDAAHCVIDKNTNKKDKKLWTENEKGELLQGFEAEDEREEAEYVVEKIVELSEQKKLKLDDFAVLYRTNAQSRALEEEFLKAAVPYKIVGGLKFYQRKEIKDILAYLYFVQNPQDKISFERIISLTVQGVGKKTIDQIIQLADEDGINIHGATKKAVGMEGGPISLARRESLKNFSILIDNIKVFAVNKSVSEIIRFIYQESGYQQMLLKQKEEGEVRHENVQELLTVAKKYEKKGFEGINEFLEEVALVSQVDRDLESKETVPLMTLHSAKGLEFKVVFLVGMEEGLFPHSRAVMNHKEMEEERRLCYVGITRAKERAFLVSTSVRNIYGSTQVSVRSRFLDEINPDLLECISREDVCNDSSDESFPDNSEVEFRDGDQVNHSDFGNGIIVAQDENIITVAFPKVGIKKIMKNAAPIKKL